MNTFLGKISQLNSICDVLLLSIRGEPLFCYNDDPTPLYPTKNISDWNDLITSFDRPLTAEFIFAGGRYYLHLTDIGYLIFGMRDESNLNKLKIACKNVRAKLADRQTRKRTLLKMLTETDEMLKPHIIKELMPLADREVGHALISLLQQQAQFQPKSKERLLLFICQALGHCSTHEAINTLNAFINTGTGESRLPPDVENAARMAIRQLEQDRPVNVHPRQHEPSPPPLIAEVPPQPEQLGKDGNPVPDLPEVRQIQAALRDNRKTEATAYILKAITACARNRQFAEAERLREWLIDIDSMAVGEIIRAAEVIEEEKKASISKEHLRIWQKLIQVIAAEAFSALFHACTVRKYAYGAPIVTQGVFDSTLFLVNRGKVQLHALCQGKNAPLKVVGPGEIFGSETFFEISVWTLGALSLDAELLLLPQTAFQKIKESYPALEARLPAFCRQLHAPPAQFDRVHKSRRRYERRTAAGRSRAAITLLDDQGKDTGMGAKGDLLDISRGGASLSFHSSQKKNAEALLGKTIRVAIYCGSNNKTPITRICSVRAVRGYDPIGNLYTLHLDFETQLTAAELQQVVTLGK